MFRILARVGIIALVSSLLVVTPTVANAETKIGGKIPDGFVFNKAGSPYRVTDTLLVDAGSLVRVEPGVTIIAPEGRPLFWSLGSIHLEGTATEKITVIGSSTRRYEGVFMKADNGAKGSQLRVSHTLFDSVGNLIQDSESEALDVVITDSDLLGTRIYAWYLRSFTAERNVFLDDSGIMIGQGRQSHRESPAVIRNNLFVGMPGARSIHGNTSGAFWINVWAAYGGPIVVSRNTFVPMPNRAALNASIDGVIDASENYWGTTDPSEIQKYVLDKADSFEWKTFIAVDRPLPNADPSTPTAARLVPRELSLKLSKFANRSSRLSVLQEREIEAFSLKLPFRGRTTCTTTFFAARDRALALRQATNSCSRLNSMSSEMLSTQAIATRSNDRSMNLVTTLTLKR